MKVLVFGGSGWIGNQLCHLLQPSHQLIISSIRLDNYSDLVQELAQHSDITHVILAAGLTGRPNIDWCETHHHEVLRVNVIAASIIADLCYRRGIHLTYLGTGCIYEYDDTYPMPTLDQTSPVGFTETDTPNFQKSFYSYSKTITEKILKEFPTTLILRIRMPISDDIPNPNTCNPGHPRNFITKIIRYDKVVNIPNSMTVLYDLLPLIPDMMKRQITGIYNFTNPGVISHNQILDYYRQYIDPEYSYTNFTLEEQGKILKAGRSNNCLDSTKLLTLYPHIPHIQDSIINVFKRAQKDKQTQTSTN